ncbi:CDP-glycerol glycerophosphotransferase family protein, partial [Staphylococcus aureus]|uniref:CDP-glycerol glycerophosphotransferase family protein n=1 Tax=Staphylococcus aureus TaxID=1280 RepID=UPI001E58AFFA
PYAMFLQLINDKKYKEFTHIWVASDYNKKKEVKKQLKKYRKIIVVVKETDEYLEALCTSRYLINNSTFPAYFSK